MFRFLIASWVLGCVTVTLAANTATGSTALTVSSKKTGAAQAPSPKTLTMQKRFSNEPVEITSISVNGQSVRLRNKPVRLNEGNDWLRGLVVRFKNVSDKPVSAVEFHLVVAQPGYSTDLITFTLKYGRTPSSPSPDAEPLMPGATAEVALSESWYDQAKASLEKQSLERGQNGSIEVADRANLDLSYVYFSDRTAWHAGSLRQSN